MSLVDFVELSADEPLPDLFCASPDIVQLGVPPKPPARVFVDITISSEQLNALV